MRGGAFLKGKEGRVGFRKITGATAPPTIVMMSREEASLVFVPASLNAKEKIVGDMMLSPRYRAKNAMRDKVPLHSTTQSIIAMLCLKKKNGLLGSIPEK